MFKGPPATATTATYPPKHLQLKGAGGINLLMDEDEDAFALPSPTMSFNSNGPTTFESACDWASPVSMSRSSPSVSDDILEEMSLSSSEDSGMSAPPSDCSAASIADFSDASGSDDDEPVFRCSVRSCKKTFKKASLLKAHHKTHVSNKPYDCEYCKNSFARNHDLKRHVRSVHGIGKTVATKCSFCTKVFSRKDSCAFHMATSCSQRPI
ncbi:Metallothionein expression activator [Chytriomyces hyalinus]|nr:Metallothionein expression activator [Chytriomyces hyalinus]